MALTRSAASRISKAALKTNWLARFNRNSKSFWLSVTMLFFHLLGFGSQAGFAMQTLQTTAGASCRLQLILALLRGKLTLGTNYGAWSGCSTPTAKQNFIFRILRPAVCSRKPIKFDRELLLLSALVNTSPLLSKDYIPGYDYNVIHLVSLRHVSPLIELQIPSSWRLQWRLFDEKSSSSDDAYSNNGLSYNWPNRRSWNAASRLFAPEKLNGQRATLLAIFLGYFGLILT